MTTAASIAVAFALFVLAVAALVAFTTRWLLPRFDSNFVGSLLAFIAADAVLSAAYVLTLRALLG